MTNKKLENSINLSNLSTIIIFPDSPGTSFVLAHPLCLHILCACTSFVLRRRFSFHHAGLWSCHLTLRRAACRRRIARVGVYSLSYTHRPSCQQDLCRCVAVSASVCLRIVTVTPFNNIDVRRWFVVRRLSFVVRRTSFVVRRSSFIVHRSPSCPSSMADDCRADFLALLGKMPTHNVAWNFVCGQHVGSGADALQLMRLRASMHV